MIGCDEVPSWMVYTVMHIYHLSFFFLCFYLLWNYFLAFQFYGTSHFFLKLWSLKLPTEVISLSHSDAIDVKGNKPPSAQDGFKISVLSRISILSRICKNWARNLMGLSSCVLQWFSYFHVEVLWGQPGLFWLYQFYYIAKLFFLPELCVSQIYLPGFIRARILFPVFEENTFMQIYLLLLTPKFNPYLQLCTGNLGFCNRYQCQRNESLIYRIVTL